jgi:archaemetzincin
MSVIYILPLGRARVGLCQEVAKKIPEFFPFPVRILDPEEEPQYAFIPTRGQYSSATILEEIAKKLPAGEGKIIGITNVDLCTPVLTFVFGATQLSGRAALVSLFRLRPEFYGLGVDDNLFFERTLKEVIHELAHTFGLIHCKQPACIMYLANTIKNVDQKDLSFCASCEDLLNEKVKEELK